MFRRAEIRLVCDVGANAGQYGALLRRWHYDGRIISFEPQHAAAERCRQAAARDRNWDVVQVALGSHDTTAELQITENSWSSSVLAPNALHVNSANGVNVTATEQVHVTTLDRLWPSLSVAPDTSAHLKIDTQGTELAVLEGARDCMAAFDTLEIELSTRPLYDGAVVLDAVVAVTSAAGFAISAIGNPFYRPDGGPLLSFDALFERTL